MSDLENNLQVSKNFNENSNILIPLNFMKIWNLLNSNYWRLPTLFRKVKNTKETKLIWLTF